jgi:hypothetical protein
MIISRKSGIAESFSKSISASLLQFPSTAEALLVAYNITPNMADTAALRNILYFATDIGFMAPALTFAQGWSGRSYLYHFNEANPWEGSWKGESSHILDVAFLFQNYNEFLSPAQKAVAVKFARDVIMFVNGMPPFPAFEVGREGAQTYGPSRDNTSEACEYVQGLCEGALESKSTILQLADEVGLDQLAAAWANFLTGK